MFKILDGRSKFYQWDLDQKLIISDPTINEVHFCNQTGDCALVCVVYEEGEHRLVDVPNILLQDIWPIKAYAHCECATMASYVFEVLPRSKPADYAYTETEVRTWENLNERVNNLELRNCAMTDVEALPTENILTRLLYRTPEGVYWFADGWHRIVDEEELSSLLTAETDRAMEAERINATAIAEETERAKSVEEINTKSISDEVDRATARENEIEESLEAHKATYDAKVSEIENFNSTDAENLASHISAYNEKVACLDKADTANAEAIANEAKRANEAEIALANRITDEVARQDGDIADATATANEAKKTADTLDNTIQNALAHSIETREQLNEEIERATQAENANAKAISNEEIRAKAEEQKNATAIANEETRATTRETQIANALDAHIAEYDNKISEIESFNSTDADNLQKHISAYNLKIAELEDDDNDNAKAISAEQTRATKAETDITNALEAHKNAYDKKVADLEAFDTEDAQNLASHISAYNEKVHNLEVADTANANAVKAEQTRAEGAEKANADAIEAEATRAKTAEGELDVRVSENNALAQNAVEIATATLDTAKRAKALSEQVGANLNSEIARATGEETRIEAKLDAEIERSTKEENDIAKALSTHIGNYEKVVSDFEAFVTQDAQNLAGHISNYNAKVTELENADGDNATAISNEATRATRKETELENALKAHKTAYNAKVEELEKAIADEEDRATEAETTLTNTKENKGEITTTGGRTARLFIGTTDEYEDLEDKSDVVAFFTNDPYIPKLNTMADGIEANAKALSDETARAKAAEEKAVQQKAYSNAEYAPSFDDGDCARAYVRSRLGAEDSILVSKYTKVHSIPLRNDRGNLFTLTPVDKNECANKQYVDDLSDDIKDGTIKAAKAGSADNANVLLTNNTFIRYNSTYSGFPLYVNSISLDRVYVITFVASGKTQTVIYHDYDTSEVGNFSTRSLDGYYIQYASSVFKIYNSSNTLVTSVESITYRRI